MFTAAHSQWYIEAEFKDRRYLNNDNSPCKKKKKKYTSSNKKWQKKNFMSAKVYAS